MPVAPFNLLPFLKGWGWRVRIGERTAVVRGADPIEVRRIDEVGWLIGVGILTNDAYGTIIVEFQGSDLDLQTYEVYPEGFKLIGAYEADPTQFVCKYYRPNPLSTAGLYYASFCSALYGMPSPYVPTMTMKLQLPVSSTQASAWIQAQVATIAVSEPKDFLVSLRKVLGIKGKLDPKLLAIGPVELKEEE